MKSLMESRRRRKYFFCFGKYNCVFICNERRNRNGERKKKTKNLKWAQDCSGRWLNRKVPVELENSLPCISCSFSRLQTKPWAFSFSFFFFYRTILHASFCEKVYSVENFATLTQKAFPFWIIGTQYSHPMSWILP